MLLTLTPQEYFSVTQEDGGFEKFCCSLRNGNNVGEKLLGNQFFKNYDIYFETVYKHA